MEIRKVQQGDGVELIAEGRLDEYWASHLENGLDQVIREGVHRIRLNMSSVTYLSSAGIRILIQFHKQLGEIQGSFVVVEPSAQVRKILDMTRLSPLLISNDAGRAAAAPARAQSATSATANGVFEVTEYVRGASLKCRPIGNPGLLATCGYRQDHVRKVSFPGNSIGIGLGAFGSDYQECQSRFGEFLAAAGAAAYLPTDGSNVPDYMLSAGSFVPDVNVLYALVCEGEFASLVRFEASKNSNAVPLSEVAQFSVDVGGSDAAGIVMIAETAGVVGAALRQPPVGEQTRPLAPFSYPEVRNWFSFTPELAHVGSLCLIAGVAARAPVEALGAFLRPVGRHEFPAGHFHAAAFQYRPIRSGDIDLKTSVASLFETQGMKGILHLLANPRSPIGPGETQLLRGACWVSPISEVNGV